MSNILSPPIDWDNTENKVQQFSDELVAWGVGSELVAGLADQRGWSEAAVEYHMMCEANRVSHRTGKTFPVVRWPVCDVDGVLRGWKDRFRKGYGRNAEWVPIAGEGIQYPMIGWTWDWGWNAKLDAASTGRIVGWVDNPDITYRAPVFLLEGESDMMSATSGMLETNSWALTLCSQGTSEMFEVAKDLDARGFTVTVVCDSDGAGDKVASRILGESENVAVCQPYKLGYDYSDLCDLHGVSATWNRLLVMAYEAHMRMRNKHLPKVPLHFGGD